MKLTLILLAVPLWAATIFSPGTYEWSVYTATSRATGLISWDGERYTVAETGGVGEAYRFGLLGFAGGTQDSEHRHRLTLAFNGPDGYGTFLRRLSEPPVTLGYLPYGHLYGGYWPDNIPRFIGCDEPWRLALAANCHECQPKCDDCGPVLPTGEEVPEPGTLALLGAALIGLGLMRRGR